MTGQGTAVKAPAGLLSHRGLLLAAGGGAMVEAGLLLLVAPAARTLAAQVTAVAPLAVFHDLRWLYGSGTWSGSLIGFWAALAALGAARTAINAAMITLAWPRGSDPPPLLALLRTGAVATVVTTVALSPLATLAFGVALLPFSWPLLASLPLLLLLTALLGHAGAVPGWWQVLPPARVAAWALASFVVLSAAAAVAGSLPVGWAVPVAGLAGLFNARAWRGVAAAMAARPPQRRYLPQFTRLLPVAPLAVVVAVACMVCSVRLAFSAEGGVQRASSAVSLRDAPVGTRAVGAPVTGPVDPPAAGAAAPLLAVPGFGSSCCSGAGGLRGLSPGGIVRQFSYRGLSSAGQPLPYGRAASNLPLSTLGNRMAKQVWLLHRQTGRPVDIVAESEGTLGVFAMLAKHPGVPLKSVVLLSPILDPGQVTYPRGGQGSGLVPGYELRAVVRFIGSLSPYGASGAQQLIGSVDRNGARFAGRALGLARDRSLHWLAVVPLADAVTMPACNLPSRAVVVPAWHGSLVGDSAVQALVRRFLAGQRVRGQPGLQQAAEAVAAAATAWRLPQPIVPSPPCSPP